MTLAAWQDALVGLVAGDDPDGDDPELDDIELSDIERAWLRAAVRSPGLAITRRVQREWRVFRVRATLPLTVRLLGDRFDGLADDYVQTGVEASSFYLAEAERFVTHVTRRDARLTHLDAVSRFELAMNRAVQHTAAHGRAPLGPTPRGRCLVGLSPVADLVAFEAPPELVLAALATAITPPDADGGTHLLLCGERAVRRATTIEAEAVRTLRGGPRRADAIDPDALESLWRAGAMGPAIR